MAENVIAFYCIGIAVLQHDKESISFAADKKAGYDQMNCAV